MKAVIRAYNVQLFGDEENDINIDKQHIKRNGEIIYSSNT